MIAEVHGSRPLHRWDLSITEARALQESLRHSVSLADAVGTVRHIAGVDCGFEESGRITRAAICLCRWPELDVVESVVARTETGFPYVPGLLSFREMPAILEAFDNLTLHPDLLLCDGQGIAHPRRLGIASHLGVWLGIPSIGVGKSRLVGEAAEPARERGARTPLSHQGERLGWLLRSRTGVRPLYVSPGHGISIDTAADWVLRTAVRYRLPEPVHAADRLASRRTTAPG